MAALSLEAEDLGKRFGGAWAVRGVSLQLSAGVRLGILGGPGAGKSTLLRLIGGELRPTQGRVSVAHPPLLLDEPDDSAAIAPGQSALVATRDLGLALALCDQITLLDRGRLLPPRSSRELRALCDTAPRQIRIRGHLPPRWAASLHGVSITNLPGGESVLEGSDLDQTALRGLLQRIWDLGLPVLSVTSRLPSVAELADGWIKQGSG